MMRVQQAAVWCSVISMLAVMPGGGAKAQNVTATTSDGRVILVNPNGTWSAAKDESGSVAGKANLRVGRIEQRSSDCSVSFILENKTKTFFARYAPRIFLFDKSGNEVGQALIADYTDNFRPDAVATFSAYASNMRCEEIANITVSGWKYSCPSNGASCDSYLYIVPSKSIPIIKR